MFFFLLCYNHGPTTSLLVKINVATFIRGYETMSLNLNPFFNTLFDSLLVLWSKKYVENLLMVIIIMFVGLSDN